ncbi:MAG: YceI family protein [Actinomycetota bacterium]
MSRRIKLLVLIVAAVAVVFVGGPWVYINIIREPAAESFLDTVTSTSANETDISPTSVPLDVNGAWKVTTESQVGYRVDEVLFGQNVTAVGRTNAVTGSITIAELVVTAAEFSVDMTTVKSDEPKRDAQFGSRIMDTLNFPTATFVLSGPINVSPTALSSDVTHQATGMLTLRGTSKPVEVSILSTVRGDGIVLVGQIPIVFAEWAIPNPSIPGISTEDSGLLEFNLVLGR